MSHIIPHLSRRYLMPESGLKFSWSVVSSALLTRSSRLNRSSFRTSKASAPPSGSSGVSVSEARFGRLCHGSSSIAAPPRPPPPTQHSMAEEMSCPPQTRRRARNTRFRSTPPFSNQRIQNR